jgi:hypothetical protein
MSLKLGLGLVLQIVSILIIIMRLRRPRLAYIGFLFICVSVLYHGLSELLQIAFPGMNYYRARTMVSQGLIDNCVFIISVAIFIFALSYCYFVRPNRKKNIIALPNKWAAFVNWRWGIGIVIFFNLLLSGIFKKVDVGYWGGFITSLLPGFTFLVLLKFISEKKSKYVVPLLILQIILGSLQGSRSAVIFNIVMLFIVFSGYGIRIRWRSLFLPGIIALILMVTISGMRSVVGRKTFAAQTNAQRIESLKAGAKALVENGFTPEVTEDFVYRFDGNAFSALIEKGYEVGIEPAGWAPVLNNFYLAIPRFLNPNKMKAGLLTLNEKFYLTNHFKMPDFKIINPGSPSAEVIGADYIPTLWGGLFGAFGIIGVWFSAVVLGWGFAKVDNKLVRSRSLLAIIVWIGLIQASLTYEQGVRIFVLTGREVVTLFLLLYFIRKARAIPTIRIRFSPKQASKIQGNEVSA